jgi:hypothetical protein
MRPHLSPHIQQKARTFAIRQQLQRVCSLQTPSGKTQAGPHISSAAASLGLLFLRVWLGCCWVRNHADPDLSCDLVAQTSRF